MMEKVFTTKKDYAGFLVDLANIIIDKKHRLKNRHITFMKYLVLVANAGYGLNSEAAKTIVLEGMEAEHYRSGRPWDGSDYDRYLGDLKRKGWINPGSSKEIAYFFNFDKEIDTLAFHERHTMTKTVFCHFINTSNGDGDSGVVSGSEKEVGGGRDIDQEREAAV